MYWKASYQKAESERLKLLNELTRLKQERDALGSREESQRPPGQATLGKRRWNFAAQPRKKTMRNTQDTSRKNNPDFDNDDTDLDIANFNAPATGTASFTWY